MSSSPATLENLRLIRKSAAIFKDDIAFLDFELKKRNKIIKLLTNGINMRMTQRSLENLLVTAKALFETTIPAKPDQTKPASPENQTTQEKTP